MKNIILIALIMAALPSCVPYKASTLHNSKSAVAEVINPRYKRVHHTRSMPVYTSIIRFKVTVHGRDSFVYDTLNFGNPYFYSVFKKGNIFNISYDSLNPKELIISDYSQIKDNSNNHWFDIRRCKPSVITIGEQKFSTYFRIPSLVSNLTYQVHIRGKDSTIHYLLNAGEAYSLYLSEMFIKGKLQHFWADGYLDNYIINKEDSVLWWKFGHTKKFQDAHFKLNGKDSIIINYLTTFMSIRDTLPVSYNLFYDTVNPEKIEIMICQPILHGAIDSTIGVVSKIYNAGEPGFCYIRLDYETKDSVKYTLYTPIDLVSFHNFIFMSSLSSTHPEIEKGMKFLIRYERNNPGKVYIILNHPTDGNVHKFHIRKNFVTTNSLPFMRIMTSYEHSLTYHTDVDVRLSYYYPSMPMFNNYNGSNYAPMYYKVSNFNRVDVGFKTCTGKAPLGGYAEVFGSFASASDMQHITYFNTPSPEHADTSVTEFLAASSSNKVYIRQVNFNTWGFGTGVGIRTSIPGQTRLFVGIEVGFQYLYFPKDLEAV